MLRLGIIERLTLPARGKDAGRKNGRSILRVGAALVGVLRHLQVRTDLDSILMPISIPCSFAALKATNATYISNDAVRHVGNLWCRCKQGNL